MLSQIMMTIVVERAHRVIGVIISEGSIYEPVFEWERRFSKILLSEHVLIPHDELDSAQLVGSGKVQREIECSIFGVVRWIGGALDNGSLLTSVEDRDDDEAGVGNDVSDDGGRKMLRTYGSLEPFLSLATSAVHPATLTRRTTMGFSPWTGLNPPLEPRAALTGSLAAVLSARLNFVDI